jgi:hypothetical protein
MAIVLDQRFGPGAQRLRGALVYPAGLSIVSLLGINSRGQEDARAGWHPPTAATLFWALLASGQITMRKVDGADAGHQADQRGHWPRCLSR